jgi:hypothetical protein
MMLRLSEICLNPDYRPAPGSPALRNFNFSDAALPITMVKFYGESVNNDNILHWETATEINNVGFEIERSVNGINFSSIGFVTSKATDGTSIQNLKYSFIDKKSLKGKSYYRLKQIDKDGRFVFSSIVTLTIAELNQLLVATIYPNPVADQLNIAIASPSNQAVSITVNDVYGRIVSQKVIKVLQGNNNYSLDVKSLPSGNYFMNVTTINASPGELVQKFLKR